MSSMTVADALLPEFDQETVTTRSLLALVPDNKADWKPHPKSFSLGALSMHLATIPFWAQTTLERSEFDIKPADGPDYIPPAFETTQKVLETYDNSVAATRRLLSATTDAAFEEPWSLKSSGSLIFTMPRLVVFRTHILSHSIHHRGQLSVYLRLLDIPLPSIYGPTADTR
jgi:uncharacterized damage-inducible protein DinB